MKFLVIENGTVTNFAESELQYALSQGWVEYKTGVEIGDLYLGGEFSKPPRTPEQDEQNAHYVRSKRDKLIADTDWMALSDNTLTAEWATYRQALRDVTNHVNFPYLTDEDWPVEPA